MAGEMIFIHIKDKPIEDLQAYKKILKEIENDCKTLGQTAEVGDAAKRTPQNKKKLRICLIQTPISNWKNGYITRYRDADGQDEDYELSVDLGQSTRNPDNHYYVLFPKDPNKLKIVANTHARGLDWDVKKWLHDYFIKFVTTFPGVFKLYYGDCFSGYGECQLEYKNGSDVPVKVSYLTST